MKAVAREIAVGLTFAAIGVVVSLAVVLVQRVEASPDPDPSRVLRGMEPYYGQSCYYWYQLAGYHPCWHDDEYGEYTAIDFNYGGQTAGQLVSLYFTGYEYFKILDYDGNCKGVRVGIYAGYPVYGDYRGDVHYLHIDVLPDVIGRTTTGPYLPLGHVASQDNPQCWTGPHLHQSADRSATTPFYTNKLADPTEGDNWVHAIFWGEGSGDEDGDDFTNALEVYIGTDPFDDCPDASWDDAWPPDINMDTEVNVLDLFAFEIAEVLGCTVGDSCYDARFDLNVDGTINVLDMYTIQPFLATECSP